MSEEDWLEVSALALKLYQRGAEIARDHGLILVDTKYEFGRDAEEQLESLMKFILLTQVDTGWLTATKHASPQD